MRYQLAWTVPALALLAAVACGSDEEANDTDLEGTAAPQSVQVTAKDFSFTPGKLQGGAGQALDVVFKNSGNVPHTFTIDELNVDNEVSPGVEATFTVIPTEAGTFSYYCRFHQAQGMVGALTVGAQGGTAPSTPIGTQTADSDGGY